MGGVRVGGRPRLRPPGGGVKGVRGGGPPPPWPPEDGWRGSGGMGRPSSAIKGRFTIIYPQTGERIILSL